MMSANLRGGAAVLAGGKSSRMGQDKALLVWEGQTLLERCLDVVRPLADPVVVVADASDKYSVAGCRIVSDLYPNAGPVGGIATALDALGPGWHLATACDMPFLKRELLALLLDCASEAYQAVVPWINGRPEPLCAVYRSTCLPVLRTFLESGQRAAHKALERLKTLPVEEDTLRSVDPDLVSFVNVNSPEDVQRWMRAEK
jgi:molybdopterin-guanine dinucleotide biosynthesis protein A